MTVRKPYPSDGPHEQWPCCSYLTLFLECSRLSTLAGDPALDVILVISEVRSP